MQTARSTDLNAGKCCSILIKKETFRGNAAEGFFFGFIGVQRQVLNEKELTIVVFGNKLGDGLLE